MLGWLLNLGFGGTISGTSPTIPIAVIAQYYATMEEDD